VPDFRGANQDETSNAVPQAQRNEAENPYEAEDGGDVVSSEDAVKASHRDRAADIIAEAHEEVVQDSEAVRLSPSLQALQSQPIDEVVRDFRSQTRAKELNRPAPRIEGPDAQGSQDNAPSGGEVQETPERAARAETRRVAIASAASSMTGGSPAETSRSPSSGPSYSSPGSFQSQRMRMMTSPSSERSTPTPLKSPKASARKGQSPPGSPAASPATSPTRRTPRTSRRARKAWGDLRGQFRARMGKSPDRQTSSEECSGSPLSPASPSRSGVKNQSPKSPKSPKIPLHATSAERVVEAWIEATQEHRQEEDALPSPKEVDDGEDHVEAEALNEAAGHPKQGLSGSSSMSKFDKLYEEWRDRKKRREDMVEQHIREVTGAKQGPDADHPSGVSLQRLWRLHEEWKDRQQRREELADQHYKQVIGAEAAAAPKQHNKVAISRLLQPRKVTAPPPAEVPSPVASPRGNKTVDRARIEALFREHKEKLDRLEKRRAAKAEEEEEELEAMVRITCGRKTGNDAPHVFERLYEHAVEQRERQAATKADETAHLTRSGSGDDIFERLYEDFFLREACHRTKVRTAEAQERQAMEASSIHAAALMRGTDSNMDDVFERLYPGHAHEALACSAGSEKRDRRAPGDPDPMPAPAAAVHGGCAAPQGHWQPNPQPSSKRPPQQQKPLEATTPERRPASAGKQEAVPIQKQKSSGSLLAQPRSKSKPQPVAPEPVVPQPAAAGSSHEPKRLQQRQEQRQQRRQQREQQQQEQQQKPKEAQLQQKPKKAEEPQPQQKPKAQTRSMSPESFKPCASSSAPRPLTRKTTQQLEKERQDAERTASKKQAAKLAVSASAEQLLPPASRQPQDLAEDQRTKHVVFSALEDQMSQTTSNPAAKKHKRPPSENDKSRPCSKKTADSPPGNKGSKSARSVSPEKQVLLACSLEDPLGRSQRAAYLALQHHAAQEKQQSQRLLPGQTL